MTNTSLKYNYFLTKTIIMMINVMRFYAISFIAILSKILFITIFKNNLLKKILIFYLYIKKTHPINIVLKKIHREC